MTIFYFNVESLQLPFNWSCRLGVNWRPGLSHNHTSQPFLCVYSWIRFNSEFFFIIICLNTASLGQTVAYPTSEHMNISNNFNLHSKQSPNAKTPSILFHICPLCLSKFSVTGALKVRQDLLVKYVPTG